MGSGATVANLLAFTTLSKDRSQDFRAEEFQAFAQNLTHAYHWSQAVDEPCALGSIRVRCIFAEIPHNANGIEFWCEADEGNYCPARTWLSFGEE